MRNLFFHNVFFFLIRKSSQRNFCIQLNKKKNKKGRVRVAHLKVDERHPRPFSNVCGVSLHSKMPFNRVFGIIAISLEASQCLLPFDMTHVFGDGLVCRRWAFIFFLFFSLSSHENYSLTFLVVGISTLILILFSIFILIILQKFYCSQFHP